MLEYGIIDGKYGESAMKDENVYQNLIRILDSKKSGDHSWFLSLLDNDKQAEYEKTHMQAVLTMLRIARIRAHKKAIEEAKKEIAFLENDKENAAENYRKIKELLDVIQTQKQKIETYRSFFEEPYFARMDLVDDIEGYNSYYIGKKGDVKLEIVDWRAPIARRYYQKSCSSFTINEYEYKTILRRAIRTKNGKVVDFKNEYLSLKNYLSPEEIGTSAQENVLDPYLEEIIRSRKEETAVRDIIQTIQEKQYEIITCPHDKKFVLQGCAGSGKTMVMLHRLSYLLYNYENIKPRDVLVITPSNSFNAFIDELAEILELERVKTVTVYDYFLQVLKNQKIDIAHLIDENQRETIEYLSYLYSPRFLADIAKKQNKVFDDLYGLFTSAECEDFIQTIKQAGEEQLQAYEQIKNASTRVRRAVLGEIKEKAEGGLYYTKPFRELMNCILDIQDFLCGTLTSENAKQPAYFYRQMMSFYKSASYASRNAERIAAQALQALTELEDALKKEIVDLARFKQRIGDTDVYLYEDRIQRRKQIVEETLSLKRAVETIGESMLPFAEFYRYLRGEKEFCAIGAGEGMIDIARYFYRETVKKYKQKYGIYSKKLYRSDAYAICAICAGISDKLTPVYSYVFVDEAQDISQGEYVLLQKINKKSAFNVFGDIAQNVTAYRGIKDWKEVFPDFELFTLEQNYRNTNQIVRYVAETLDLPMQPIGFDGPAVEKLSPSRINSFFKEKKGLKTIICSEGQKQKYNKKMYNDLTVKGKVSRNKINIMSVYESKGLEFSSVVVVLDGLSASEKYIACTRALKNLAIVQTDS